MIIPAILEKSFLALEKKIKIIAKFSPLLQIDVCDGKFVSNRTFLNLERLKEIRAKIRLEVHLMVENPKKFLLPLLKNKKIFRIIIHRESFQREIDLLETISQIHRAKKEVFLALNPDTPIKTILSWVHEVDGVLFLTVYPGFQGSSFQKKVLKKICALRQKNKDVIIAVDGGINTDTLKLAKNSGANLFTVGSFILKSNDPKKTYQTLDTSARKKSE